jgi:hypothetical protein
MSCVYNKGPHTLMDIFSTTEDGYGRKTVVRWCQYCGAVVQDLEIDGHTRPGAVAPMTFPQLAHDAAKKQSK